MTWDLHGVGQSTWWLSRPCDVQVSTTYISCPLSNSGVSCPVFLCGWHEPLVDRIALPRTSMPPQNGLGGATRGLAALQSSRGMMAHPPVFSMG